MTVKWQKYLFFFNLNAESIGKIIFSQDIHFPLIFDKVLSLFIGCDISRSYLHR